MMDRSGGPTHLFSGVRISNQRLVIATLEYPDSGLQLRPGDCALFLLASRGQADLRDLFQAVDAFVRGHAIHSLVLRGAPSRGSHQGSGLGFKIEAALQLLKDVSVAVVPAMTISCWEKRTTIDLPRPEQEKLGYADAKLQSDAIKVAAWAAEQARDGQDTMHGRTEELGQLIDVS